MIPWKNSCNPCFASSSAIYLVKCCPISSSESYPPKLFTFGLQYKIVPSSANLTIASSKPSTSVLYFSSLFHNSSSACLRSVMSRAIDKISTGRPSGSRMKVNLPSIGTIEPSLRYNSSSTVRDLDRSFCSMFFMASSSARTFMAVSNEAGV
ncbi:hypothetical protein ES707_20044 [subsurface metagenome]